MHSGTPNADNVEWRRMLTVFIHWSDEVEQLYVHKPILKISSNICRTLEF